MESEVVDSVLGAAIGRASDGLDRILEHGAVPANSRDAITVLREIEELRRKADAAAVTVLDAVDEQRLFRSDGHNTAKTMVKHVARLSGSEATSRMQTVKVMRALAHVADAYRAGRLGTDQIRLLGRIHANRRVADQMVDNQHWFLNQAARTSFHDFNLKALEWERIVDEDGPTPAAERSIENRDFSFIQDFNLSWHVSGGFGSLQGASIDEIFGYYLSAERLADWEKARAEHGDTATENDLPRTEANRRADAFWQMTQDAASNPNGPVPVDYVHNILWDGPTFETAIVRTVRGRAAASYDPETFRCETLNGVPVDPDEAAPNALLNEIRRVLVDSKSTVIDQGQARGFTGAARQAVKMAYTQCVFPGCGVPSTHCETDHIREHGCGGRTCPDNGAPLCGRHNRLKQTGFTIWRDPTGQWHTYRPDGTEIPP